jgi:hypothetical protein
MSDDDKIERRQDRADRKINNSKGKSLKRQNRVLKKYGYDYEGAMNAGISPDEEGHWASRNPETGEIFKGRKHPTMFKTKEIEKSLGYKIKRKRGKIYSVPKSKTENE